MRNQPKPENSAAQQSKQNAVHAAYEKLAQGITAVLEVEGQDSPVSAVLRGAVVEICGFGKHQKTPAFVGLHVAHFGQWKANHPNE